MCGLIAGIGKVSLATLDKAVTTLTHRGPESSATWVSDNQSMFLGHTRLCGCRYWRQIHGRR